MIDQQFINDFSAKINRLIPNDVKKACGDIEKNIKAIVQSTLSKVDMISREEFDAQCKVLARTRQKLDALEKTIKELEERLNEK